MKNFELAVLLFAAVVFLFVGCSSSKKGVNSDEERTNNKENVSQKIDDNFDLTPYHTTIAIPEVKGSSDLSKYDIWYSFPKPDTSKIDSSSFVTTTTPGYRVQVLSTDDLQKANELKSELYLKINQKNIYLEFEPPFYKVKIGDFINQQEANNLKFKLNQLGYKDSRVISENINVVKQQQ